MPDRPALEATDRTIIGKAVKGLRRAGKVPGILYGTVVETPIPITVDSRDLYRTYIDYGSISLIDVNLNGDSYTVYIRNVHQDEISREPIHVELFAPNLLNKMTASVPVILTGESPNFDGVVTQLRDTVELEGLPTDLPGAIEVDVSGLVEIDDAIYASDITIPDNVDMLADPEEMLVRLMEVRAVEEEEVEGEELEEGAEAPEGEEAAEESEESSEDEE